MAKTARQNPNALSAATSDAASAAAPHRKKSSDTKVGTTGRYWTEEETKRLLHLHQEMGDKWTHIAAHLPGRTGKQCQRRAYYQGALATKRKKEGWSITEDETLATLQQSLGNKWTAIAASIPGRTSNDVKNRYYSLQRRKTKTNALRPPPPLTPIGSPCFDNTNFLNSSEFVEEELDEIPPLPVISRAQLSSRNNTHDQKAASALMALKSGATPKKEGGLSPWTKASSPTFADNDWNKENEEPMAAEKRGTIQTTCLVKRFTYPSPPLIKFRLNGVQSPVVQAKFENVTASNIFSPSYVQKQITKSTPSSGIPLNVLPQCDSIPLKRTPMQRHQPRLPSVAASTFKPSPLVSKNKEKSVASFTPLTFNEMPSIVCHPSLYIETAEMLQEKNPSESGKGKRPRYSPIHSFTNASAV